MRGFLLSCLAVLVTGTPLDDYVTMIDKNYKWNVSDLNDGNDNIRCHHEIPMFL